ncbi:MAG: hypothetical protein NTZ90_11325 [Proteobacteria bacterium]|nr:hypothetical protein [Pseudomonadota bacterium]
MMEVRLPNCYGFFAVKKVIEEADHGIPIFVMSHGYGGLALKQLSRWSVLGYIRKPFSIGQLSEFVQERLAFFSDRITLTASASASPRPKPKKQDAKAADTKVLSVTDEAKSERKAEDVA